MKKLFVSSLLIGMSACGGAEKEPLTIINTDEDVMTSPNNEVANNEAPNNAVVDLNNDPATTTLPGTPLLGNATHTLEGVDFRVISTASQGMRTPRDLAFHPTRPTELWVLNLADNSTVVIDDPDTATQAYVRYAAIGKDHFMVRPAALAFGDNGNFGTAQEEDQPTQGDLSPGNFMGPSLWIFQSKKSPPFFTFSTSRKRYHLKKRTNFLISYGIIVADGFNFYVRFS